MTEQEVKTYSHELPEKPERPWEDVTINEELFKVKRNFTVLKDIEGESVPFMVDLYDQVSSKTQILVWKKGMDQPRENPALARIDYGCICINAGDMPSHDCRIQRKLTFKAIKDAGIGAIATVSEVTTAGNGHGMHVVLEQASRQAEALLKGEDAPSMQEAQNEMGYYGDARQHSLMAGVLHDSLGQDRPIVPITSNQDKIDIMKNAGFNVLDGYRIELQTKSLPLYGELLSRRRTGNYLPEQNGFAAGAYIVTNINTVPFYSPLTKESYANILVPLAAKTPARRMVN